MLFLRVHQVAIQDVKRTNVIAITKVQDERRNCCMAQVLAAGEVVYATLVLLASCACAPMTAANPDCGLLNKRTTRHEAHT